MTHDPLCKLAKTKSPVGYIGVTVDCDCHRVRYIRKQVILQCLTAVEYLHDHEAPHDAHKDALWNAITALRALQEKP